MQISSEPDVLVAIKKSRWEHHVESSGREPSSAAASLDDLRRAHQIHRSGVEAVLEHLEEEGISFASGYRSEVDDPDSFDLVVTVGGDGTVLDLSHRICDVPILAVNSHPSSSVGYFCAGTAKRFPALLTRARAGRLSSFQLMRFRLEIDGAPTGPPVLNDVLIGHANPAAVSRYQIKVGDRPAEMQTSSGIWLSTPAGSTAAIRSAGGYVLPLGCRCIQYLVREPYPIRDRPYRHRTGIHPVDENLEIRSRMQNGRIFVDGPHITNDFDFGSVLRIDADAPDLSVFGLQTDRRASDG